MNHLSGMVRQAKGVLRELETREGDLAALESLLTKPLPLGHLFDFTGVARSMRDEAKEARLRVAEAQRRVKLSHAYSDRTPATLDKFDAQADAVKAALKKYEDRAARAARAAPGKPLRRQHSWTREEALDALNQWAKYNGGRWPTARELPRYKRLPSRGTLGSLGISLARDRPGATPT